MAWNRSSKKMNFSVSPLKVIEVVLTGLTVIECGLFGRFTSTSASRLIDLVFVQLRRSVLSVELYPPLCHGLILVFAKPTESEFVLEDWMLGVASSCHHEGHKVVK